MGAEYINPQWRLPNEKTGNSSKYSMYFDGNNYITTTGISFLASATAFSMGSWINFDSLSASGTYIGVERGSGNQISIKFDHSSGELDFTVNNGGESAGIGGVEVVSSSKITANTWHHIMMVYDGSATGNANRLKAFIDGSPQTLTFTGTIPSVLSTLMDTRAFNIGGSGGTWGGVKKMVHACLFDYALSATGSNSIATLYNGGTTFNPMALSSPPINYYPLGNSAHMGSNYLTPNGALQDYVFDINGNYSKYFNLSKTTVGSDDFTFSFWVKPKPYAGGGGDAGDTLLGNTNGAPGANQWNMWIYEPTGRLNLVWYNETNNAGNFMTTNFSFGAGTVSQEWVQVVLTRVGTTVTFYFNGVVDTATAGTLSSSSITLDDSSNATMRLPSPWSGAIYNQDGFYSNLLWHNVGLSAAEVQTLYNYGSPIKTLANIPQNSNLKAWYKLDASEIYDSSNTQWQIANNVISSKAYSFNGTNNIEITQNSSIQTSNFSIGLWIKGYPQLDKTIIENGGANGFSIKTKHDEADKVLLRTGGVDGLALTGALNGEWNFVYFTMSGNASRGGINGGYSNAGGAARNYDSSKGLFIGSKSDSTSGFTGEIAQVVYYSERGPNNANGLYGNLPANPPPNPLVGEANPSLVSWWKLDAASITDSNGSNNGTNNGATLFDTNVGRPAAIGGLSSGMIQSNLVTSDLLTTSSYSPYALAFDGNDYINCGNDSSLALTSNFSVSAWMKSSSQNSYAVAVAKSSGSNGFSLQMRKNGNRFAFNINDSTDAYAWKQAFYDGINPIDDGKWHHVVGTFDGSTIKIYVDNIKGTDASSGTMTANTGDFTIARQIASNGLYFNGQISNVSYWNTVLTAPQVREIYNEGLPSNLNTFSGTAPVAWWQLGSNSSFASNWTVLDEIGTNNGTSTSMLETAIVDGVGTSGNGTSTNMGTATNISGSSPSGEGNSLSVNMTLANIAGGVN